MGGKKTFISQDQFWQTQGEGGGGEGLLASTPLFSISLYLDRGRVRTYHDRKPETQISLKVPPPPPPPPSPTPASFWISLVWQSVFISSWYWGTYNKWPVLCSCPSLKGGGGGGRGEGGKKFGQTSISSPPSSLPLALPSPASLSLQLKMELYTKWTGSCKRERKRERIPLCRFIFVLSTVPCCHLPVVFWVVFLRRCSEQLKLPFLRVFDVSGHS